MQLHRNSISLLRAVIAAAALLGLSTPANAEIYGFSCITGNSAYNCAVLQDQVQVQVTPDPTDPVLVNFRFTNSGPLASSITDVYFSDLVPLLGLPLSITWSPGVRFSPGCSPRNLPGGNSYGFSSSYCADSDPRTQPNGVNPGEWLNLAYTLQGAATFGDVISSIEDGAYRIGIHVQGFGDGGSESGINRVSEPVTLMLFGTGLLLVPVLRRFRVRL